MTTIAHGGMHEEASTVETQCQLSDKVRHTGNWTCAGLADKLPLHYSNDER
jgi:hypothetical protein